MGTVRLPVPVTGFAADFSPMPLMAPPPLGSDSVGPVETGLGTGSLLFPLSPVLLSMDVSPEVRSSSLPRTPFPVPRRLDHVLTLVNAQSGEKLAHVMEKNSRR